MKDKTGITVILITIIIILLAIIFFILNPSKTNGSLQQITYEEIQTKKQKKEDFILIVSRSDCSHCLTYKPKVKQIAEDYNIVVYYIDYDHTNNPVEFLKEFNLSGATPMTLFFKNGKESSVLNRIEGDLATSIIKEKFKKMGFIE